MKIITEPPNHFEFNSIPHVSLTHDIYENSENIIKKMDQIISKYKLNNIFKVCSLHKHYDIKENDIFIVENIKINNEDNVELARPINKNNITTDIYPISYYVTKNGDIKAYKFAYGKNTNTINYMFFKEISDLLINTNEYSRIAIKRPTGNDITEIEIPEYNATILFPIKYSYIINDEVKHSQTAKGEKHALKITGNHSVFWKRNTNVITEPIFRYLELKN